MVVAAIASVILSTAIAFKPITPILHASAVIPFYYLAMVRNDFKWSAMLVGRWAVAVYLTILIIGVFVPERVARSLPAAIGTAEAVEAWINHPASAPPADFLYLVVGIMAFAVVCAASGGVLGFIPGSIAIGSAAYGALFLFRHGQNVVQISLVAVPLWHLSFLLSGIALLVPMGYPLFKRRFHLATEPEGKRILRILLVSGVGLFLLSLLLRLTTASAWRSILDRWTLL
jgi:hypothetical protein